MIDFEEFLFKKTFISTFYFFNFGHFNQDFNFGHFNQDFNFFKIAYSDINKDYKIDLCEYHSKNDRNFDLFY